MDRRRHLAAHPGPGHRQRRRGRAGGVDLQHRLQQGPGPSALSRGPEKGACAPAVEALAVDGEALGRSRGGLTRKIHLEVDGRGRPMSVILTAGQAGDNSQLLPLLDQVAVRRDGPGRPRKRPDRVLAVKAYSHPSTRAALRRRGIAFDHVDVTACRHSLLRRSCGRHGRRSRRRDSRCASRGARCAPSAQRRPWTTPVCQPRRRWRS